MRPNRRSIRIAQTREAILDGAARAFARHGYQASTMRSIAQESGYTAPSLYNYFKDKEEIISALSERLGKALLATLEEAMPVMAMEQRVELLVRRWLEFSLRNHDALRVFFSLQIDRGSLPKGLVQRQLRFFRGYLKRLAAWLNEAQGASPRPNRDPEDLALFLWATFHAFHVRWLEQGEPRDATGLAERIIDLFLNGARGGHNRD